MSNQNCLPPNDGPKPGGNTGSVHGEAPLIRKKEELTPEQYKRQRNNLIFSGFLIVVLLVLTYFILSLKDSLLGGAAFVTPASAVFPLLF
mgnify:CR=1 FL=1